MNNDELKDAAHSAFESAMAFGVDRQAFERLARTVRDAEREACATVCDTKANNYGERADLCDDDEDAIALKSQAWQMSVLAAELRERSS